MEDYSQSDRVKRTDFRGIVDYEGLLAAQVNRIADTRAKDLKRYEDNVDTLCVMLPSGLRGEAREYRKEKGVVIDLTERGKQRYDLFWIFINELLEKSNLIFKTSSFEVGSE